MVVGIRQTSRATRTVTVTGDPLPSGLHAIQREGQQRDRRQQEDDRQGGQENIERDFIRRLLALGAFHHGDHPVQETFPRAGRDANDEPVGEHLRAACDGAAIAAAFPYDRRAFAGDRALIHGRHPFDDLAVGGDEIACLHEDTSPFLS